jgi:hypothetical protein
VGLEARLSRENGEMCPYPSPMYVTLRFQDISSQPALVSLAFLMLGVQRRFHASIRRAWHCLETKTRKGSFVGIRRAAPGGRVITMKEAGGAVRSLSDGSTQGHQGPDRVRNCARDVPGYQPRSMTAAFIPFTSPSASLFVASSSIHQDHRGTEVR